MRILQLTKKFPFPLKDGESIATFNLSKGLATSGCEISLLSMNTTKHFVDLKEATRHCGHYKKVYSVSVDNEISLLGAALNLLSKESYHTSRFRSKDYEQKLRKILHENTYDVILIETIYLSYYLPAIRELSDAKIVLRAHNVEYEIWERICKNEVNALKKQYLKYLTKKLKRYEIESYNGYDLIASVSDRDQHLIAESESSVPVVSIPIGLDVMSYKPHRYKTKKVKSVGFIGALDWIPNAEGIKWFLDNAWPYINKISDAELFIAGRNYNQEDFPGTYSRVHFVGEIPDAKSFMTEHDVLIVPLLSGSGTRVKILEGMALGKAIVTTHIGVEGIHVRNDVHIAIRDEKEAFAQAVLQLLVDENKNREIGKKAAAFINNHYHNNSLALKLVKNIRAEKVPEGNLR